MQSSIMNLTLSGIVCFLFGIKFRETNQIVVALVATTFNALLSVAKTNGRGSGREFYSGNVDNLF